MGYIDFKTPFLGNLTIKEKSEAFRNKFWNDKIPIDIEKIIELKLKLDIIPIPDLTNFCDTDALITSNWKSIYIDKDKYSDERYNNRLRFSLAHEIGHFILHKSIYENFKIENLDDFYKLIEQIPQQQYNYIETQANKFANHFLIPRDKLTIKLLAEKNKFIKNKPFEKMVSRDKIDIKTLNSYIAIPLAKIFSVSEDAIEIALSDINSNSIS